MSVDQNASREVIVVGAGVIGCGWAVRFACAGLSVAIHDADPTVLKEGVHRIQKICRNMSCLGLLGDTDGAIRRVRVVEEMTKLPGECIYAQECVSENAAIKERVFQQLDAIVGPQAVLASSTSALLPEGFLRNVAGRERCLVAHPFNPPHVMPLVEIVRTEWVSDAVVARTQQLLRSVGQVPIVLQRALPGFATNRLQAAVVNEAIALVADGILSPRDVDLCMTQALGLRWCFLGPFQTMDLNSDKGFLDYARKFGAGYVSLGRTLNVSREWSEAALRSIDASLRESLPMEQLTQASDARDAMIAKLGHLLKRENFLG